MTSSRAKKVDGVRGRMRRRRRQVAVLEAQTCRTFNQLTCHQIDTQSPKRWSSHENTRRMIQEPSGTHFEPDIAAAFSTVERRFRQIRHEMQS